MLESRAERSALGAAPDIAVVVVDVDLNVLCPNTYLKKPTSKQTHGPGTISASDLTQREACFDLHKRDFFFQAEDGIRDHA